MKNNMNTIKNQLGADIDEIVAEFNNILSRKGHENITIRNFRLDLHPTARCQRFGPWEYNPKTHTFSRKCLDHA